MKFGVVVFPGSNCDEDCYYVVSHVLQQKAVYLWHKERDLQHCDALILPGGFSYGDYLRTGAIARFAPIMPEVIKFARQGGLVIGICNGFQILVEAGLLPGALLRNTGLRFICRHVYVRVEHSESAFTNQYQEDQVLRIPIAHNEGRYTADAETLGRLNARRQVLLRYCDCEGRMTDAANPNGSADHIAGLVNDAGNVFGLMPHPERSSEPELGSSDGRGIFASMMHYLVETR